MDNPTAQGAAQPSEAVYYPVLLDLRGRSCLALGSGPELAAKVQALEAVGARVRVVSRPEDSGTWAGHFLVLAAGLSHSENAALFARADAERVLFHAVDDAAHSHFIHPAVYRQGKLIVAISTSGACPALAVRLRQRLAAELGPEWAAFVEICARLRARMRALFPDAEQRRRAWYRLVDSELLARLGSGEPLGEEDFLEVLCRSFGTQPGE